MDAYMCDRCGQLYPGHGNNEVTQTEELATAGDASTPWAVFGAKDTDGDDIMVGPLSLQFKVKAAAGRPPELCPLCLKKTLKQFIQLVKAITAD